MVAARPCLQASNCETDHLELFRKRLSDNQLIDQRKQEKRANESPLAMNLAKESERELPIQESVCHIL